MKELLNAANAYAFDLEAGDLNTNRDTFIAGAQWMKKRLINKACEWLRKDMSYPSMAEWEYDLIDEKVGEFRKAMEEEE